MIGSMAKRRPIPAATPATMPRSVSRRHGAAAEALMPAILPPSLGIAGALQAGGEQDRADGGGQQRPAVAELEGDRVEPVEQQDDAGDHGHDSGDERGPVRPPHAHIVPPSKSRPTDWSPPRYWSPRNWSLR